MRGQKGSGTGLCLDLSGGKQDNGTPLEIWDCNGSQNQLWYFPEGSYKIMLAVNNNKCVDAGSMSDGTQLVLWDCNGLSQQTWGYDSNQGTLYLASSQGNGPLASKCADVAGQSTQAGTALQVWECNNQWVEWGNQWVVCNNPWVAWDNQWAVWDSLWECLECNNQWECSQWECSQWECNKDKLSKDNQLQWALVCKSTTMSKCNMLSKTSLTKRIVSKVSPGSISFVISLEWYSSLY